MPHRNHKGFPNGSAGKESLCSVGDTGDSVQSLGLEDPLQEEMATHSNILTWRIPWTEEPGRVQSMGLQSRTWMSMHKCIGTTKNSIETCILSVVKQITSPGWMHEKSACAWCIGKTQRDQVEREVGGGIRMGNTCKSMADSCQCMTKTTTIL